MKRGQQNSIRIVFTIFVLKIASKKFHFMTIYIIYDEGNISFHFISIPHMRNNNKNILNEIFSISKIEQYYFMFIHVVLCAGQSGGFGS